ncbi:MAG: hypothetical protein LBS43_07440 [Prevotellaceae bacterium]|jgi:hypothetical protein|nr:hypothetical protein [Prevotellaceae bacterium]
MIVVVDIVRKVVAATAKRYGGDVFFFHGHIREIASELTERSRTAEYRKQKYPCIMLLEDFRETHATGKAWDMEAALQLLIVASSDQNYTPDTRIEKVFAQVLYPVYDAFIESLKSSIHIQSIPESNLKYQKIDRHRCTSAFNEAAKSQGLATLFADHLDAVELNLDLKLIENCI